MLLAVVNYHYIHDEGIYPYPGIYPTPVPRFQAQLEQLGRHFDFIRQEDLLKAAQGEGALPEKSCLITFDDGLRSQYENALPILEKLGVPGIFFVIGKPYAEQKACTVHKIHYCRANMPAAAFLNAVALRYQALTGRSFDPDALDMGRVRRQKLYDNDAEARLKFLLNQVLDEDTRGRVMEEVFREVVSDEPVWCREFYMGAPQVAALARRGYLGIHSYSHANLIGLPAAALRREFTANIQILEQLSGQPGCVRAVSYPYGSVEAVSVGVARAAAAAGLALGFTMERAFNESLQEPLLLARLDTNDAIGGKSPLCGVGADGCLEPRLPLKPRRSEFFQEMAGQAA